MAGSTCQPPSTVACGRHRGTVRSSGMVTRKHGHSWTEGARARVQRDTERGAGGVLFTAVIKTAPFLPYSIVVASVA
jgi:hypothetical protein